MCFQSARASSDPFTGSFGDVSLYGPETAVVTLAAEINGCVDGTVMLGLRLLGFAGVAERRDPRDVTVSEVGEHGAVLNLSEGVGEAMPESCSRDVSEIKIDGLSTAVSKEADLCSCSWVSKPTQIRSMVGSADATGPR
jgi:hypothetical protein